MFNFIRTEKQYTKADREKMARAPGRPHGRVAGGWVSDLVSLGKAVVLCGMCQKKFKAKSCGYEVRRLMPDKPYVIGECDGCGNTTRDGQLYMKRQEK